MFASGKNVTTSAAAVPARGAASASAPAPAASGSERKPSGFRSARRVEHECARDRAPERLGQVGPHVGQRRRARLNPPRGLAGVVGAEGVPSGERLPQHHADRPDVGRCGGVLAEQPFGRDVGERPGHVPDRGQGVELLHLREPEVE